MHEWTNIDWNQSNGQIAKLVGCSASTVSRYRKKMGISKSTHIRNFTPNLHSYSSKTKSIKDLDYEFKLKKKGYNTYSGGKTWSKAVKRLQGERCKVCDYFKPPVINHSHHIVPLSEGGLNTIRNGIVLCSRCHNEVHAGLISLT